MLHIDRFMEKVIRKYGHFIVYVRADKNFYCSCWEEHMKEADPLCNICYGTGYKVKLQRMRVRSRIVTVFETLPGLKYNSPAGNFTPKAFVYYFMEKHHPKAEDLILEVEWDENKKVKRITDKHRITVADPKFGDDGVTAFYQVYVSHEEGSSENNKAIATHKNETE